MAYIGSDKLIGIAKQVAARALNESAIAVADQAIADVPKLTGRLASSARIAWATPDHLLAQVTFDTPYARYIEEGQPRHGAERVAEAHFLSGSLYQEVPNLPARVEHELRPLSLMRGIFGGALGGEI